MRRGNLRGIVQVRHRAGYSQDPVVTPSREAQAIEGALEEASHIRGGSTEAADLPRRHLAIRVEAGEKMIDVLN